MFHTRLSIGISPLLTVVVLQLYFSVVLALSIEGVLRRFPPCANQCGLQRAYRSCLTYQPSCPCNLDQKASPQGALPLCGQSSCSSVVGQYLKFLENQICAVVHDYRSTHNPSQPIPLKYKPKGSSNSTHTTPLSNPKNGASSPSKPVLPSSPFSPATSAGVGVGIGLLIVIVMTSSFFLFKKYRRKKRASDSGKGSEQSSLETDGTPVAELPRDELKYELPTGDHHAELETEERKVQLATTEIHELPS